MSFKEDQQKNILTDNFMEKNRFLLTHVKIHVIYVKSFKLKWIFEDTQKYTRVKNLLIWVLI